MTSGISLHVLYDGIDSDLNPLRVALASLQPRVINIVGGARKREAFTFAVELRKKYPNMRIIFRNWPDDGAHDTAKYKLLYHRDTFGNLIVDDYSGCQRWIDDNVNYLIAGLTVLTDNESMRADLDVYSEWNAKIMDLAGAKGWSVAVGRFATGNPPKAQLPQLNSMFRTLLKWGDLHCFSPNEYFSKDPTRNGGNVYRYKDAVDYAKSIGAWPFPVTIGEFGLLFMDDSGRLDPEAGFKDNRVGLNHTDAARFTINTWKQWYKNEDVDVCIFGWGSDGTPKWDRCRVDNSSDFLKVLLDAATAGELDVIPVKSPVITPNYVPTEFVANERYKLVIAGTYRNLRRQPSVATGEFIGQVNNGAEVVALEQRIVATDYWWKIRVNDLEGWVSLDGGRVEMRRLPPPVVILPPPKPSETTTTYTLTLTEAEYAEITAYRDLLTAVLARATVTMTVKAA